MEVHNLITQRRAELRLTQSEASRRARVSLAAWRRFEIIMADGGPLDEFRGDNVTGFARALRLSVDDLRHCVNVAAGIDERTRRDEPWTGGGNGPAAVVRLFRECFRGDPITPAEAMALVRTVANSDFRPTADGRFHVEIVPGCGFAAYLKGETTIRDVELLCDLPESVLIQVNGHWLVRMGERIMWVARELSAGRVPRPTCLADEYALLVIILNTEPPQSSDIFDVYPELRDATDACGCDPDFDDFQDPVAGREKWIARLVSGLLPPDDSRDLRRRGLVSMEFYRQGIYDLADPRHPLRWFDRDDVRSGSESDAASARP